MVANETSTNFVDATDTETKRTTFYASTIHVVTDHENELENGKRSTR